MSDADPRAANDAAWDRQRRAEARRPNGADPGGLSLIHWRDMCARLDGRPLVKRLLVRSQISLIIGESGCGKTFLALDLALHVAAGMDWFGRRVTSGPVVYVAAEAGGSIVNRLIAWREYHDLAGDFPVAAITSPIDLCRAQSGDLDRLIAAIRAAGFAAPALVIIDTVSRVLAGGNENAPDDMGALVRSLDRLREELGCHVCAVHHLGKDTGRGSRGHSLLHCAVDTEIAVTRHAGSGIATATVTKQRDSIAGQQLAFSLVVVELGKDQDGEPVTSCVIEPAENVPAQKAAERDLPAAQKRALESLADAIARGGEIPPGNGHIPAGVLCVTEAVWRDYCYAGQISSSDKPDAKQKAFKRAAGDLVAADRVGKWGEQVWLIQQ